MRRSTAIWSIFAASWPTPKQPAVSKAASRNVADFVLGEPNNAVYIAASPTSWRWPSTEKVPFHLEIVQPKVPLVRSGTMNLESGRPSRRGVRRADLRAVSIHAARRWCGRRDHDRERARTKASIR